MDFSLSTYQVGKPTRRIIFDTFWYFLLTVIMFVAGIYFFLVNWKIDNSFFTYFPHFLLFLGVLSLVLGIRNLVPKTIIFNDNSIKYKVGGREKSATWSEVSYIRSTLEIGYFNGRFITFREAIIIKTEKWKCTLKTSIYDILELKEMFKNITEYALKHNTKIIDELGWIPKDERNLNISSGISLRTNQYKILKKGGLILLLIGIIFIALATLEFILFAPAFLSLFFGFMCALTGWLGIEEEKKKLERGETP